MSRRADAVRVGFGIVCVAIGLGVSSFREGFPWWGIVLLGALLLVHGVRALFFRVN